MALTQVKTNAIADDAVTTDKLANAINTERTANTAKVSLENDSVTAAKIADNAVVAAAIADNAVVTAGIADEAVTLAKLPHGDGSSNGKFLRSNNGADPTWETVSLPVLDAPSVTGDLTIVSPGTVTHTISNYSPSVTYVFSPTGCTIGSVNSSGQFVVTHTSGASVSYTIKATTTSIGLDDSSVVTKTFTAVNLKAPTINSPADPRINTNVVYTITSTTTLDNKLILDFGASTFNYGSVSHGSGSKVGNTVEVTGFGTNNPAVTVQFTSAATYSVKAKAQDTNGTYGDSAYSATDSITATDPPPYTVNYLVVAGGGGGGLSCCGDGSGGGGGGGFRASWNNEGSGGGASSETALTLQPGTVYTITVGDGGPGGNSTAGNGGNSSIAGSDITNVVSIGGGAGAGRSDSIDQSAKDGGSGGGGAYGHSNANIAGTGTSGQGYNGGTFSGNPYHPAGGGGGAGGAASGSDNEHGGAGKASTIRGSSATYAVGGRGGSSTISTNVVAGGANTGTGGDGGYAANGANGGSGIVVLRMATSSYSGTQSGGTVTTSGSDTIISYTTVASNHTYTA